MSYHFDFIESHYAALRSLALRLRQYLRIASEIFLDFSAAAALLSFFISSLSCSFLLERHALGKLPSCTTVVLNYGGALREVSPELQMLVVDHRNEV